MVLALLKLATHHQSPHSNLPLAKLTTLPEAPPSECKREFNRPESRRVQVPTDNLELPIPDDVQAMARYYGADGPPNIRDVAVIWQKRQDRYINFLDTEDFQQGLYRSYMGSELGFVLGNRGNDYPTNPHIIRIFARTRRFSKLVSQLMLAKDQGHVEDMVASIDATVKQFIKERQATEQQIYRLIKERPEIFVPGASESVRRPLIDLCHGFCLTGLDVPEGIIPMSLEGTQLGVVNCTFLLGLAEHPRAIQPLLDILSYDDEPLIRKFAEIFDEEIRYLRWDYSFANPPVIADAIDRILVASAENDTLSPGALALANEYKQWRQASALAEREVVQIYAYDAPRTPYHLPGKVIGVGSNGQTFPLELPINLGTSDVDLYEFDEHTIGAIIDWAKRFDAALEAQ
jgi:hypothetical protein